MRDYTYIPYGTVFQRAPGGPEPLITVHERGDEHGEYEARATWESEQRMLGAYGQTIEEAMALLEDSLATPPPAGHSFFRRAVRES